MSDEPENTKAFMVFGRDVSKIPCFRNSFLYGTLGGLGFGLSYFMFSSKVAKSVNYSIYSFSLITIGYWIRCRYEYSRTKFEMMRLQELMKDHSALEGSEMHKKLTEQPEIVEV